MGAEYEVVRHSEINNLKIFIVDLAYRTLHMHQDLELLYILKGAVDARAVKEGTLPLREGDLVLIHSGLAHELMADGNALILAIQVNPAACTDYFPQLRDMEFEFRALSPLLPPGSREGILKTVFGLSRAYFKKERLFELRCMGLLNDLLYQVVSHAPYRVRTEEERNKAYARGRKMRDILEHVEAHCHEKLLLSDVARKMRLSVSYLSHFFTESFGLSFQEYLANLRCERARRMLLLTGHTILTISAECGFSDLRYLNQAFLRVYGCTPKQYRKDFEKAVLPKQQESMLSTQDFLSAPTSLVLLEKHLDAAQARG
jgi:AraC-like DNA-binding protein